MAASLETADTQGILTLLFITVIANILSFTNDTIIDLNSVNISTDDNSTQPSVLQSCIKAPFTRVALAGAGFLADAYDLFVINLVLRLLKGASYLLRQCHTHLT
jgi:hypothetical protein